MAEIFLIACAAKKKSSPARAALLYDSALFSKSLAYARSQSPDKIFILSAKFGLLHLDREIPPYEMTLNKMGVGARRDWAEKVIGQLGSQTDLSQDEFTFLAGQKYREFLMPHMRHTQTPLAGRRIGEQLQWLGNQ